MRRSDDFRATVRGGRRAGGGTVTVHLAAPPEAAPDGGRQPTPTAGFVVSRAVGTAVVRNRVRRRLRHLVAGRLAALPPGSRLVVRAAPSAAQADSDRLGRDLERALDRALDRAPDQRRAR
jgi:ribonuclease P protein component